MAKKNLTGSPGSGPIHLPTPGGEMRPKKGSDQPKPPIRSGRSKRPGGAPEAKWRSPHLSVAFSAPAGSPVPLGLQGFLHSTCFLGGGGGRCSPKPQVPLEPGVSTLHHPCSETALLPRAGRRGSSDLKASLRPLPPPPVSQVRKRGPERVRAQHRVTKVSAAGPKPVLEPLRFRRAPRCRLAPVPDQALGIQGPSQSRC